MSFYTALTGLKAHKQIFQPHRITLLMLVLAALRKVEQNLAIYLVQLLCKLMG